MTKLRFVQVDVFSARPLEGNQLAVFIDAGNLRDEQMQALARETNLAETTFVTRRSPDAEREQGYKVRIFTVKEELPFAGHPTLGTAFALRGQSGANEIALDLKIGRIPVNFSINERGEEVGEMRQRDPEFLEDHSRDEVARATGLHPDDLDNNLPVQTVSTGVPFTIVPVRSLKTIQRLPFNWANAVPYLERHKGKFFYFVCCETVDPAARLHARMLFYNGEDPGTGSAAGCAASWMAAHGVSQSGERVLIEQGIEIQRPSRIFVRAERTGDHITNVRVGGSVVEVARGEYLI